jgi:hypothetical protein
MIETSELTIEDCDEKVAQAWDKLKTDTNTPPDQYTTEIDRWLDQRLHLMKGKNA